MDYLVTGGNRGIGFELVRQLHARGDRVFAACRHPEAAEDLHDLATDDCLVIVRLNAADPVSIADCATAVAEHTGALDVLINNAAIGGSGEKLGNLTQESLVTAYTVNAAGPLLVAQAFLPLLRAGAAKIIVNISSGAGSISRRSSGGSYDYSASKAALNMHTRNLSLALADDGITSIVMDPGWVKTDMGGPNAHLEPETSVSGMLQVIDGLTIDDTGKFYTYQGGQVPW